jgi:hypothetical protein
MTRLLTWWRQWRAARLADGLCVVVRVRDDEQLEQAIEFATARAGDTRIIVPAGTTLTARMAARDGGVVTIEADWRAR